MNFYFEVKYSLKYKLKHPKLSLQARLNLIGVQFKLKTKSGLPDHLRNINTVLPQYYFKLMTLAFNMFTC